MNAWTIATVALAVVTLLGASAHAEIKTETIEYKAGDATMKGLVAYDDAAQGKRPAVIVYHEWWGANDYVKRRARAIAELGYVAFVADMYGDAKTTDNPDEAGKLAGAIYGDADLAKARRRAALDAVSKLPQVNADRIAAIGYCFGGAMALQHARDGAPLRGVVSFHGALKTDRPAKSGDVKAKVLVLHGGADPLVPPEEVKAFEQEMTTAGADYRIETYPGAKHAFTNPDADKHDMPPLGYQKEADEKSWEEMKQFLAEVLKS
jgi:dienelactone hydrolase